MSKIVNVAAPKTLVIGTHDAVVDGDLIKGITTQLVFIQDSVDPTSTAPEYLGDYPAGTFAVNYSGTAVYHKNDQLAWVAFGQAADGGDE